MLNTTIPTQDNSFCKRTDSIYGRHIDDVITSLRRGFEIGDHLQIKGKTSLKVLI